MSLLNKLFRTIKDTTGIDAGNLADTAQKNASYAMMSKKAKGLALLNWRWSEDANMSDYGTGKPLRNWDRQTKLDPRTDDIYLSWQKQPVDFEEYLIFIGWQGWPYAIIERDHPEQYFLPEYVEALAEDKFNSVKHIVVKASDVLVNCVKFPASKTDNEFYYVKLIGKTADEKYYDIKVMEKILLVNLFYLLLIYKMDFSNLYVYLFYLFLILNVYILKYLNHLNVMI